MIQLSLLFHSVCMVPNSPLNNSVRNINFAVSVLLSLFLVVHFSLPESKFGLIQYLVAHLRSRVHNPPNKSSSSYSVKKIECCVARLEIRLIFPTTLLHFFFRLLCENMCRPMQLLRHRFLRFVYTLCQT